MESVLQHVNLFDLIIGSVILILAFKGFINGVVKEVFGLVGLVGGVYTASRFAGEAAHWINANLVPIENIALAKLIGFMGVLVVIWLTVTLIGILFSKLISASGLGFADRLFGFVVGGGKYFIIFALIVTALSNVTLVKENIKKYVHDSLLYPLLVKTGEKIIKIDPAQIGLVPPKSLRQETQADETNASVQG
jgi:membrane protein required for colicin V production